MADKPTEFPEFATQDITGPSGQPNVVEPDTAHKNEGWIYNNPVTRGFLNWLHRLYNEWIQWFEQEIELNKTNITNNTSDISTNTAEISQNTSDIVTNSSNIANNFGNISTNTGNISTNTTNISTNTSNIANNFGNISTNTTNIGNNASDITALDGRVSQNESDISNNDARLDNINFRSGNISVEFNTFSAALTATMEWLRVGRNCTLFLPQRIGTLATASGIVTITQVGGGNWPSEILPKLTDFYVPGVMINNNLTVAGAYRIFDNAIQLMMCDSGDNIYKTNLFLNGSQCGCPQTNLTYTARFD